MMGYKYEDIQAFGAALSRAQEYVPALDTKTTTGLVNIWDFFEGLLAEGYVEGVEAEEESNV
jgi:hypothetical protein